MIIYFFMLILTTTMTYFLYRKRRTATIRIKVGQYNLLSIGSLDRGGFLPVFGFLAFFSAVRDGIGVDYESYMNHILMIQQGAPHHYMEIGFKKTVKFLEFITVDPRFVIIVAGVVTTWLFARAIWEQSSNPVLSIFLFLSWGYYFFTFNTIRNFWALAIVMYAIRFIKEGKKIQFILFVLVAATFHKSALFCLPIYFISDFRWKKLYYPILGGGILATLFLKDILRTAVFYFYPRYEGSAYDIGRISYLNIVNALVVITLCVFYYQRVEQSRETRLYFHLNVLAFCLYVGMYWIPEISRIGFYLNTTSLFLVPNILNNVENEHNKKSLKIAVYLFSIILFYLLCREFYGSTIQLLPYRTWIF